MVSYKQPRFTQVDRSTFGQRELPRKGHIDDYLGTIPNYCALFASQLLLQIARLCDIHKLLVPPIHNTFPVSQHRSRELPSVNSGCRGFAGFSMG